MALQKDPSSRQRQGHVKLGMPRVFCTLRALMAQEGHKEIDPDTAGSDLGKGSWEGKGKAMVGAPGELGLRRPEHSTREEDFLEGSSWPVERPMGVCSGTHPELEEGRNRGGR